MINPYSDKKINELPVLTLAYIGDAVYELWIRTCLINRGIVRPDALHKTAVIFVRAKGQALLIKGILPEFNEKEQAVFYRGRNAKGQYPRHGDVLAYRHATGFEAVIGYLYLSGRQERLEEIFKKINTIIEIGLNRGLDDLETCCSMETRDTDC